MLSGIVTTQLRKGAATAIFLQAMDRNASIATQWIGEIKCLIFLLKQHKKSPQIVGLGPDDE